MHESDSKHPHYCVGLPTRCAVAFCPAELASLAWTSVSSATLCTL